MRLARLISPRPLLLAVFGVIFIVEGDLWAIACGTVILVVWVSYVLGLFSRR